MKRCYTWSKQRINPGKHLLKRLHDAAYVLSLVQLPQQLQAGINVFYVAARDAVIVDGGEDENEARTFQVNCVFIQTLFPSQTQLEMTVPDEIPSLEALNRKLT